MLFQIRSFYLSFRISEAMMRGKIIRGKTLFFRFFLTYLKLSRDDIYSRIQKYCVSYSGLVF